MAHSKCSFSSVKVFFFLAALFSSALIVATKSKAKTVSKLQNRNMAVAFSETALGLTQQADSSNDNCDGGTCYAPYGKCNVSSQCECNEEYTTIKGDEVSCRYKRKLVSIAAIGEALIPIGFGHFYCKNSKIGFIKLGVFILIPSLLYLFATACIDTTSKSRKPTLETLSRIVFWIYVIGLIGWYITDIVLFSIGFYKDGNDVNLI